MEIHYKNYLKCLTKPCLKKLLCKLQAFYDSPVRIVEYSVFKCLFMILNPRDYFANH